MLVEKILSKNTTGEDVVKSEKWLELLLDGSNTKEFNHILSKSKTLLFALCKYKKILRQRDGRGIVPYTLIETAYRDKNVDRLHILLSELFLEYYTTEEISEFLELMKETDTTMAEVYDRHLAQPENTLLSHLTL